MSERSRCRSLRRHCNASFLKGQREGRRRPSFFRRRFRFFCTFDETRQDLVAFFRSKLIILDSTLMKFLVECHDALHQKIATIHVVGATHGTKFFLGLGIYGQFGRAFFASQMTATALL